MITRARPVLAGVGLVENPRGGVARVAVLPPAAFGGPEEQALLEEARRLLPGIPFDALDVLVVDQIGKNYSGAGMDTTVIGRVMVPGQEENARPQITAIVVLGVSPESHGNAAGLGMADVTTRRVVQGIDFRAFYLNGITSGTFGLRRSSIRSSCRTTPRRWRWRCTRRPAATPPRRAWRASRTRWTWVRSSSRKPCVRKPRRAGWKSAPRWGR